MSDLKNSFQRAVAGLILGSSAAIALITADSGGIRHPVVTTTVLLGTAVGTALAVLPGRKRPALLLGGAFAGALVTGGYILSLDKTYFKAPQGEKAGQHVRYAAAPAQQRLG